MEVVKARHDQIPEILTVISQARSIMRETGNATQWANGYPSTQNIADDIASGNGYVCVVKNEILGYFFFACGVAVEPSYGTIEGGNWLNRKPYGVIHRLASARKANGIAKAAFDYAFSKIDNIRVDTHRDNVPMQNYLKKNGFTYCGVIYVSDQTPRDAFQKEVRNGEFS